VIFVDCRRNLIIISVDIGIIFVYFIQATKDTKCAPLDEWCEAI